MTNLEGIFQRLEREVSGWQRQVATLPASSPSDPEALRRRLEATFSWTEPMPLDRVLNEVLDFLKHQSLHTTHPRHFGLFSPGSAPAGVVADALTALFNPNEAAWWYAPASNAIETHTLRFLSARLGYDPEEATAHFTSGGSEANLTGTLAALARHFPGALTSGLREVPRQPRIYLSDQAHDSFVKIARVTGLGTGALRRIPSDGTFRMATEELAKAVERDRRDGFAPFLVVATAGTTGVGAIDPLPELADFCRTEDLWLHVDAAWGGMALLSDRHRGLLRGIERADSVTWDVHKCLPVPMGAGVFLAKDGGCVKAVFDVTPAYVPERQAGSSDPYSSTLLWSRRCIGLKVLMTLAELGAEGTAQCVDRHFEMAEVLRRKLRDAGFTITNEATELPLVCFTDPAAPSAAPLVRKVVDGGAAWISIVRLPDGRDVARACITNHVTGVADVDALVGALRPSTPSVSESYDRVAPEYSRRIADELAGKPLDRQLLDEFIEQVGSLGPICDLGCGPGHIARYLHDRGAPDVIGIDLSPGMVTTARSLHPAIMYQVGDMLDLDVSDGSWGGMVAFYSIIHVPRQELGRCFREIHRVLRPGGTALFAFHIGKETVHLDEWWGQNVSLDFHFLEPANVVNGLEGAGFGEIRVVERDPYGPEVEHQSRRAYVFARKTAAGVLVGPF